MKLELEFSLVGSLNSPIDTLLAEFEKTHGVQIKLRYTDWNKGWQELVSYALYGNEPHVSHIGSSWVSSLMRMNALRKFTAGEIQSVGGAAAFLPASWQSVVGPDTGEVWGLPWTAYTFLIAYRRDLLQQAGIEETGAFDTAQALTQTLVRLQEAGVKMPWVVPVCQSHTDTLHYVASWIWGAGGDLVSPDGKQPLFAEPAALAGLQAFYDLYRYLPPDICEMSPDRVSRLFWGGEAAVTLCGVDAPYIMRTNPEVSAEILENLGFAPAPGIPWIGGDDLVIWRNAQYSLEVEQAAVALVSFLVSPRSQEIYSQLIPNHHTPTRLEVLSRMPLAGSPLAQVVEQALRRGRCYPPISLWGRIETQLCAALNQVWAEIFSGASVEDALQSQLIPLARRLRIALSG